jgi:rare lipoprotein A (peptidoglycan hydrolase)
MNSIFRTLLGALLLVVPLAPAKSRSAHRLAHHAWTHVASRRPSKPARTGWASWYGKAFQGRRMADGQRFNRFHSTAASRTLPLGAKIRVLNLRTGLDTVVTITDRGPWVRSRILDLAEAPAKQIQCSGLCPVEWTRLPTE